ncbi:hypothetical protein AAFF_G00213680 [Aldrovandia affinis]|uniref:Endonuclease/exonuclease/phosphatase domain-containing protein n=1 Tax=Aldrovandia affinis TaxID=143900 RepID=A0AAD7RH15_9TELE|nr:hypothetical protein AAFF_G00213680 [Aldrovandia affinis]
MSHAEECEIILEGNGDFSAVKPCFSQYTPAKPLRCDKNGTARECSLHDLPFLALTKTWITPQNTATPAALSAAYTFSHTPRPTGPLGSFLDEMDALLSAFPEDGTPVLLLGDFNLPLETSLASAFLPLLQSFDFTLAESPSTHKASNQLDLIFTRNCASPNITVPARISACLADISAWMSTHHLKLNLGKTGLLFLPAMGSPMIDALLYFQSPEIVTAAVFRNGVATITSAVRMRGDIT